MPHLKALMLSALIATTALFTSASATPVYFSNDSGQSGVVDVYVDGQLVFDNVFADDSMMFPRELSAGQHNVVVTPNYLPLGEQDILRTTLTVPEETAGNTAYTINLATETDDLGVEGLTLTWNTSQID
ncbi:DUF4397 domain-containing protein [Deinococcus hopiensis]|uniref:DUF4397 domain-containing protein n=1 Tax=Deinococcus hopiensis KR-140 TaxID=695939 RepID=A0A1W1UBE2_9DEIO|nr:DUF4397 domain-containing protein [Deinococcus hopiensis]SMB78415.1 protein of unknown function [Deinococcus hopiensis KR-140]